LCSQHAAVAWWCTGYQHSHQFDNRWHNYQQWQWGHDHYINIVEREHRVVWHHINLSERKHRVVWHHINIVERRHDDDRRRIDNICYARQRSARAKSVRAFHRQQRAD